MGSYGMDRYLGPNLMGTIRGTSGTGEGSGGSGAASTSATDYQAIYDAAQPHGYQFPQGQSGYTRRAAVGGSVILEPQGRLGAPTYQITQDGRVFAKPVKPNAQFQPVAGPGTVNMAAAGAVARSNENATATAG